MKNILAAGFLALSALAAHAEYEQVNLTVFGMDCAPCAHAIHVSMKGIQGVNTVDVDLNTGLVSIKLTPGNSAAMRQFNEAVEKNGFTHKDANVVVRGQLSGSAQAPFLEVTGTKDRYASDASGSRRRTSLTCLVKRLSSMGFSRSLAKGSFQIRCATNP